LSFADAQQLIGAYVESVENSAFLQNLSVHLQLVLNQRALFSSGRTLTGCLHDSHQVEETIADYLRFIDSPATSKKRRYIFHTETRQG